MRDILAWALGVEVVGLAVLFPLRSFFDNRRDAALLSRPVGLAVVAYLAWVLSQVTGMGFSRLALLIALAAVGLFSWYWRRQSAPESPARAPWWGDEERLAAILFWGATGVFLIIRAAGPSVYGAEKYMDMAFLNSLARFDAMPPGDPWMAAKTINYYYWGYLLAAAQAKLTGFSLLLPAVPPMVSYNLSVATFPGFAFAAAACLGLRLSRGRLAVGLGAAAGTVFAGNVAGALDAWASPFAKDFDYWHASRVIASGNTINEFPFFTFFHADLHPHLLAFPFFLAAFAVAHRWIERGVERPDPSRGAAVRVLSFAGPPVFLALIAGTAWASSLWNLPAMSILLLFSGVFLMTRGRRWPSLSQALLGGISGGVVLLVGRILFARYELSFNLINQGLARADLFSGWIEFLGVWGALFAVLALGLWPMPREATETARRRRDFFVAACAGAALLAGFVAKASALSIVLFLATLAAAAGWRALRTTEGDLDGLYAAFLVLLGLAMIGGCELIYFKDSYGHDLERMNTIFKFYHQAWPLLAIGAAVFVGRAWQAGGRKRVFFRTVLVAAALVSVLYPVNAAVSRLRQKNGPWSLDAGGPLKQRSAGDAAAVAWLLRSAPAGSVILEATGDPYSDHARISVHTGIPTVLGWANHESLWRPNDPDVFDRINRVRQFYSGTDPRAAWDTIQRYGVTHVIVGDVERKSYPQADRVGDLPFLEPVSAGSTWVYRVQRPR